jgi:hypothetical protein
MSYEAWRDHNAANITEWLTPEQLRAECGRLLEVRPPSPELLLMHAMRALEDAALALAPQPPGAPAIPAD